MGLLDEGGGLNWERLSPLLTQTGIGLLGAPNWQQGVAKGVGSFMEQDQEKQRRLALVKALEQMMGGGKGNAQAPNAQTADARGGMYEPASYRTPGIAPPDAPMPALSAPGGLLAGGPMPRDQAQVAHTQPPGYPPLNPTQPVASTSGGVSDGFWARTLKAENASGDPNAVSSAGAVGVAQVMPETAMDPGYGVPSIFDMADQAGIPVPSRDRAGAAALLRNPALNEAFGRSYADAMHRKFGGDERLTASAYNAGPGATERAGGVPNYAETQNYVRKVAGDDGFEGTMRAAIGSASGNTLAGGAGVSPSRNADPPGYRGEPVNRPAAERPMFTPGEAMFLRAAIMSGHEDAALNMVAKRMFAQPEKREMIKGADGYTYYADTGERVLPGVRKDADPAKDEFTRIVQRLESMPPDDPARLLYERRLEYLTKGSGTTVNVGGGQGEFEEKAAGRQAEMFQGMSEAGEQARGNVAKLSRLREHLSRSSGSLNGLRALAGSWGIPVEGAADSQAAQAIIASLIPTARVPGSGTTSDFDAKQFEKTFPRLMGTPEGNQYILDTLDALAKDRIARGDIAEQAMFGEITPQEARRQLRAMPAIKLPPLPAIAEEGRAPGAPSSDTDLEEALDKYGR